MIKGLSEARRMPRLGKIHLGIKKTEKKDGTPCAPYPSEVDYFVCPQEVQDVFGEKPQALKIMIPVEETDRFFPQFYKRYTTNLLQCKGNGETAFSWAESGGLKEIPCPCDLLKAGECKQIAILSFLLPDVQGFGVYQITTSSKNSIIDLNSSFDMVRNIAGRVRMIPLILRREAMTIQRITDGKPKKSTHYTLKIDLDATVTLRHLQQLAQTAPEQILLSPPDESKDELFYPENGFESEEIKDKEVGKQDIPALSVDNEAEDLKDELSEVLETFREMGGQATQKQNDRLDYLGDAGTAKELRDAIDYYAEKIEKMEDAGKGHTEKDRPFRNEK